MRRTTKIWAALLGLLATLALIQQPIQAQGPTGDPALAEPTTIYLPVIRSAGTPPPPPPPPPARAGFFTMDDLKTYNAATAVDSQGVAHLAFYVSDQGNPAPLGQPAFYTSCAGGVAACGNPANWAGLVQMDSQVNQVQIAVTSDGRPRILIRRNGQIGDDHHYWTCEARCNEGGSWAGLFVTQSNGVELRNADMPQRSFALDAQDRPRFIWSHSFGNGRPNGIYYAFCDAADCAEPGSWQHTRVAGLDDRSVTSDYSTLRFDGDMPRFLTRVNHSGLPVYLAYFACNQGCDEPQSWQSTTLEHPDGNKMWAGWDLELDGQGRPRIALYEPAPPSLFVGGKLFYGGCDTSCGESDAPFTITQVASGEGQSVDLAIDPRGRTHMVYDAGQRGALGELWCDAGCGSAGSWQRRTLETSEQLQDEFAPASPLSCDQQERVWLDAIPQVAFDAQGRMLVAYDITNVARCYTIDPADPTHRIYSEVRRIWWAVRVATFGRA